MGTQVSNIVKAFGRKWWIACSIVFLVSCSKHKNEVPYYFTPDLSPVWNLTDYQGDIHTIKTFEFVNHEGALFGSNELKNKCYVVNFFFTSCPSICPKMSNNLKVVADSFINSDDFALLSLSVTPEIDSIKRLKQYHSDYQMSDRWHLLTGNQKEIYSLSRQSFFVEEEIGFSKDSSDFLHTERCILVDKMSRIRGIYNATIKLEMERLVGDIRIIMNENES